MNDAIHRPGDLLPEGRYALDRDGRLHPARFARVVRAVCYVRITHRDTLDAVARISSIVRRVKPVKQPAPSPDPCPRCGAAGRNGCAHYLPYDGGAT